MNFTALGFAFLLSFASTTPAASATNRHNNKINNRCLMDLSSTRTQAMPAQTLRQLTERTKIRATQAEELTPKPGFDNIEEQARIEQVGEQGPQAFQQLLPFGVSFINTPAPTATTPLAVDMIEEGRSIPVHVDVPWDGRRTSTAAFLSLPLAKVSSPSKFLVGPEYPVVVVHVHGGGTPTSTGRNGMSIAKEIGKRGIPVIGLDMPGHGRATRNPDGLETFKKQADWLMKAVKQLIDPKVKIVLTGHSWGGSFALFMHRLSLDPNYSRISEFISMAPPIDVSMGGDPKLKLDFEEEYQRNLEKYKPRIADTDFDFLNNLLNNGKASDVGAYFTHLTDFDYLLPPLTPEEQAKLKKLTVIVGTADGLVYVGREPQFDLVFGNLQAPSQYYLLGPGLNWKSKDETDLKPTGHNGFDRFIDGTRILETYKIIGDTVLNGEGSLSAVENTGDPAMDLVERSFRHYANFFGFREMLRDRVEFVMSDTDSRMRTTLRRDELEAFVSRVKNAESEIQRMADGVQPIPAVKQALDALRARLNLPENYKLKRAHEELATKPLTPERRVMLEDYIARIKEVEATMRAGFVDQDYEQGVAQLNAQFTKTLSELGIRHVNDYKPFYDEYTSGLKEQKGDRARLRGDLSRIHQRMAELTKKREGRFGVALDTRLAQVRTPPEVRDQGTAERELVMDHSPERKARLREFVAEYDKVESRARQQALDDMRANIMTLARPEGVASPAQAAMLQAHQDSLLNFTYSPVDQPDIQALAREIARLNQAVFEDQNGDGKTQSLAKLDDSVRALRSKRAGLLKGWDSVWKSGKLTSPGLAKRSKDVEQNLAAYKELYTVYEHGKSNFLLSLKKEGQLTAANILAFTPELRALRRKVQRAKQVYLDARGEYEASRVHEVLGGALEGPEDLVKRATTIARDLWGADYLRTGRAAPNSLTHMLQLEEEYLETRQIDFHENELELNEARVNYTLRMSALNQPLPYRLQRVEIGKLFDQPLHAVLNELNSNPSTAAALTQLLSKWEAYLAQMRLESHSKKDKEADLN